MVRRSFLTRHVLYVVKLFLKLLLRNLETPAQKPAQRRKCGTCKYIFMLYFPKRTMLCKLIYAINPIMTLLSVVKQAPD